MKKLVALVLSALACAVASPAWAAGPEAPTAGQVVFPTGVAAADVANVQTAVDAGGPILLKATDVTGVPTAFEFDSKRVFLTNDVAISGETLNGSMTTVRHGAQPFRSLFPLQVQASIRGIHFDMPRSAAVLLTISRGFEFTDNLVTDVVGAPFFGLLKGQAVWVTEGSLRGAVVGKITIAHNVVERVHAELSYGVALAALDAEVSIVGNTFRDTKHAGILVVFNSKPTLIEHNSIVGGLPYPGFSSSGNGIFVGLGAGAYVIRRNTVVSDNPLADGILLEGTADLPGFAVPASSLVEKNDVTMHGSQFGGITIYGAVQPSLIARNKVHGDGAYALDIVPFLGGEICDGTVFQGNNISHFEASIADVFLDVNAHNTVFVGHSGTVIDKGVNNRFFNAKGQITEFRPMTGGAGRSLKAAQDAKRQLMQQQSMAEAAAGNEVEVIGPA